MKHLLFLLLLTFIAYAESITIAEHTVNYDEMIKVDTDDDGFEDRSSYYLKDELVFTTYDRNKDGKPDLWFRFAPDLYLDLEVADNNFDGKPDVETSFDKEEEIIASKDLTPPKQQTEKDNNLFLYAGVGIVILIVIIFLVKKKN